VDQSRTTAFLTLTNETLDAPEFCCGKGSSFVLRGWDVWTTRSIFNTRACDYTNSPVRYGGLDCKSGLCFSNPWFLSRKGWIRLLIWSFDKEGYSAGRG